MGIRIFEKSLDQMTAKAFMLLKVSPELEFTELYDKLFCLKQVTSCNAVKGDIDIIIEYQTESVERTVEFYETNLKKINGVTSTELLLETIPNIDPETKKILFSSGIEINREIPTDLNEPKRIYSYILIKAQEDKLNIILPLIALNDNIFYCGYLSGSFNLMLLVSGVSFSEIDKLIQNKFMKIEGVLKIKEYPVINIYNL